MEVLVWDEPSPNRVGFEEVSTPTSCVSAWLTAWPPGSRLRSALALAGCRRLLRDSHMMYSPISDTATIVAASNDRRTFWNLIRVALETSKLTGRNNRVDLPIRHANLCVVQPTTLRRQYRSH